MTLHDLLRTWPPALASAILFYLVWVVVLAMSLGATWLRNRIRLLPEVIPASDWLKASGAFLLVGVPASAGIAAGVGLIQLFGWLGGDKLVVGVSTACLLAVVAFLGIVKWFRAG